MLISAINNLNSISCYKIKALNSLLNLPQSREPGTLWPKNTGLLNLKYNERRLNEYDPD
jgi:hypothetical protein